MWVIYKNPIPNIPKRKELETLTAAPSDKGINVFNTNNETNIKAKILKYMQFFLNIFKFLSKSCSLSIEIITIPFFKTALCYALKVIDYIIKAF